jgi:hypothetical protein
LITRKKLERGSSGHACSLEHGWHLTCDVAVVYTHSSLTAVTQINILVEFEEFFVSDQAIDTLRQPAMSGEPLCLAF